MAKEQTQQNTKLVTASARGLHISPRKMRLVTNLVKGMRASDAITQLQFTNKKAAVYMARLIRSAIANAENNFSINPDNLFVKTVTCDMGQSMKRYFPRARGSAFIIRHKLSHVNLVLEDRPGAVKKSRFALPKRDTKKAEPTITQEGSAGVPEAAPEVKSAPKAKAPKAKAQPVNVENDRELVEQKTSPEQELK